MEARPPPIAGMLLLGASLFLLAGLLWWGTLDRPAAGQAATVDVRILDPKGEFLFGDTGVVLSPGESTVLGALLGASHVGNFSVQVTYGFYGHAFVTSIKDIENKGSCGWVWDRNGARGDRAADAQPVQTGDQVQWGWACEG